MFNKKNDKQNGKNMYYTGYGMYPAPVNGAPQNMPSAGVPAAKSRKMRILSFLRRFNWLGLAGFALYIGSVCTGHLYIALAIIAFAVSLVAFILRKRFVGNFFAYAGLVLSCVPAAILLFLVMGFFACGRKTTRHMP